MKIKLLLIPGMAFLLSCTGVYFENPQPAGQENLSSFPKKLTGTYTDTENGDTIVTIYKTGLSIKLENNDVKLDLSEQIILRKYKSYYFINLKEEDEKLWLVYIVKPAKSKTIDLYEFSVENDQIEKLKSITEVKINPKDSEGNKNYIINPSLEEMGRIINAGLLQTSIKMKK